jgi:hypothetical protein
MEDCECHKIQVFGPWMAARSGHLECLIAFKEKDNLMFKKDRDILAIARNAAYNGQINILNWLHSQGYSHLWTKRVLWLAQKSGSTECSECVESILTKMNGSV